VALRSFRFRSDIRLFFAVSQRASQNADWTYTIAELSPWLENQFRPLVRLDNSPSRPAMSGLTSQATCNPNPLLWLWSRAASIDLASHVTCLSCSVTRGFKFTSQFPPLPWSNITASSNITPLAAQTECCPSPRAIAFGRSMHVDRPLQRGRGGSRPSS
jgi:hypothetical protein